MAYLVASWPCCVLDMLVGECFPDRQDDRESLVEPGAGLRSMWASILLNQTLDSKHMYVLCMCMCIHTMGDIRTISICHAYHIQHITYNIIFTYKDIDIHIHVIFVYVCITRYKILT